MKPSMIAGITAAALAAISWSIGFVVPFVIGPYSLFDFTLLEFLLSAMISAAILWRNAQAVVRMRPHDLLIAGSLGLIGYVGYFLAVMGAAVYAGPVVAPAFVGLVPVVLAVAGNLRERSVSWGSLVTPLALAATGLALINVSNFAGSAGPESRSLLIGIPLAMLALTLWVMFGLMNQSALAKRPTVDGGVWAALILIGAGLSMLAFVPVGLFLGVFQISRLGLHAQSAGPLLAWAAVMALFANVGGATAWTYAAQRLPVALSAQLVTLEPLSATVLGLLVHRRWPTIAETLGMLVLLVGVIVAIGVFARASPAAGNHAT